MKKIGKKYYVCTVKADNSIIICSTKAQIARFIGVSVYKLGKLIGEKDVIDDEFVTLWRQVKITRAKKGFNKTL